jgi:hypothetical protein
MSSSPRNTKAIRGQVRAIFADQSLTNDQKVKAVHDLIPVEIRKIPFDQYGHTLTTRAYWRAARIGLAVASALHELNEEKIAELEAK